MRRHSSARASCRESGLEEGGLRGDQMRGWAEVSWRASSLSAFRYRPLSAYRNPYRSPGETIEYKHRVDEE
jgi:hypothetical protein